MSGQALKFILSTRMSLTPDCDLDCVPHEARERGVRVTLCNCIGSKNSALVIQKISGG